MSPAGPLSSRLIRPPLRRVTCHAGLALLLALGAGCASVPSPYAEALKASSQAYARAWHGATRAEIAVQMGPSTRVETDGAETWETRFDDLNYTRLTVWFDDAGRVDRIEHTRARGHRTPVMQASSSVTWSR